MKLREIQIDRFGVWNDLTLPIHSGGVTVVYGPNEAGKTTLLQFIRGVLYGYQRAPAGRNPRLVGHERMSGSLLIEEAGRTHRFHRAAVGVLRGNPCLIGEETAQPAGELLEQMLHGISEHVFNSVFSIELRELQELAGLSSGEVAEHIYGTSLGPEGRDLLAAGRNIDAGSHRLIDPLQQSGELVRLFEQHDELSSRLRSLESATQQHEELCARRDDIEQEIAELKRRLGGIQSQLRGHLFLERAWGPWNRLQECERELDSLPQIAGFPEHGLERLHRLESEIAEARECRDRLSAEIKELRAQWKALPVDDAFRRHAATIKGLVAQQSWLAELDERIAQAQQSADDAGLAYEAVREKLGADCTENRLANFDTAPLSRERLFGTAESFRGALARRGRIRRECRRLAQVCRRKTVAVRDGLKSLGVESAEQALAASRRRLDDLQRIARLELHEADLQRRLGDVRERLTEAVSHNDLPTWVYIVLGVFCFSGIVLAGWGLITGVSTSWIAGGVYAMLALTCAGLAWGIRQHFEVHTAERVAALNSRASKWHTQLAQTQDTLRQLKLDAVIPNQPADQALSVPRDTAALVRQELLFAAEIEELARHESRVLDLKERLRERRRKLDAAHREVGTARSNWGDLTRSLGMPENVTFAEASAWWERIVAAKAGLQRWSQAEEAAALLRTIRHSIHDRLLETSRKIDQSAAEAKDPLVLLAEWQRRLDDLALVRNKRRLLRRLMRDKRREAAEFQSLVADAEMRRNALLVQGGATTRDEFEQRARALARRTFLEDQADDAQRDLEHVSRSHSDLAIVEEDLQAFQAEQNAECIETLKQEAADLEHDIEAAYEQLGGIKHSIDLLEGDDEGARIRFEREQTAARIAQAAAEWCALEVSAQTLHDLRQQFERTQQPATLSEASHLLRQLTCGRYINVWSPLEDRNLHVDDDSGRSLSLDALSRGTKEQLLLAVRLAVIGDLAYKGIKLPLLLDDILVNFDERRTEAAAQLLLDWANQGQGHQILFFTCHPHLARLFESRGVELIHLPADQTATRLAG